MTIGKFRKINTIRTWKNIIWRKENMEIRGMRVNRNSITQTWLGWTDLLKMRNWLLSSKKNSLKWWKMAKSSQCKIKDLHGEKVLHLTFRSKARMEASIMSQFTTSQESKNFWLTRFQQFKLFNLKTFLQLSLQVNQNLKRRKSQLRIWWLPISFSKSLNLHSLEDKKTQTMLQNSSIWSNKLNLSKTITLTAKKSMRNCKFHCLVEKMTLTIKLSKFHFWEANLTQTMLEKL